MFSKKFSVKKVVCSKVSQPGTDSPLITGHFRTRYQEYLVPDSDFMGNDHSAGRRHESIGSYYSPGRRYESVDSDNSLEKLQIPTLFKQDFAPVSGGLQAPKLTLIPFVDLTDVEQERLNYAKVLRQIEALKYHSVDGKIIMEETPDPLASIADGFAEMLTLLS